MLGKLLKYEWKATGKILLPVYLIVLILSPIVCLIARIDVFRNTLGGIISSLILSAWGLALFAMMILTFITVLTRFYRNLLKDEGYLMHTLPVSVDQHIAAKGIAAFGWTVISTLLFILISFGVPILSDGNVQMAWKNYRENWRLLSENMSEYLHMSLTSFILLLLLLLVSALLLFIFFCYISLALGHLFQKHRVAGAVGCGVAIWIALEILFVRLAYSFAMDLGYVSYSNPTIQAAAIISFLLKMSVSCLVLSAVFYFVTRFILKRKLNLE